MGGVEANNKGLLAIITKTPAEWRINYYGLGFNTDMQRMSILAVENSDLRPFMKRAPVPQKRLITNADHHNFLVHEAYTQEFDVYKPKDVVEYVDQLKVCASVYVKRCAEAQSFPLFPDICERVVDLRAPYKSVREYRVEQATRFFEGLNEFYVRGFENSSRVVQKTHDFIVKCSTPLPVVLDVLSREFEVDFFDLQEDIYSLRDSYVRHQEDFLSTSVKLRKEIHSRLLRKRYDVSWRDPGAQQLLAQEDVFRGK